MESQTEEGADLTSPEEVEEVGEGEPVAGMMVMILAWILDPPDPEGIAFPPRNDHILDFLTVFPVLPLDRAKDAAAVQALGTGVEDAPEMETGPAKVETRLSRGPWPALKRGKSRTTASGQSLVLRPCRRYS